tara:strand:- start:278 stop:637 length:360 start_codon:yes stop_codon:yes gene_type:complete
MAWIYYALKYNNIKEYNMKIKVKKKHNVITEDNVECHEYYVMQRNKNVKHRLMELEKYHKKLDILREEEKQLKHSIQQLKQTYNKMKDITDGISTDDLFHYCSRLNDVSKGKYDDKDKK